MRAKVAYKPAYRPTLNISLTACLERSLSMPENQSGEHRIIAALLRQLLSV
jgi:hypothetical protein